MSRHSLLLLCMGCALLAVEAHPRFMRELPGIPTVDGTTWIGVGHFGSAGGGKRNPFGLDFAEAGHKWTVDLCQKDSDKDGFTNGQELGDPDCKWVKGMPPTDTRGGVKLSHPGLASSTPL